MISTDDLIKLEQLLDEWITKYPEKIDRLKKDLVRIRELPEYREWRTYHQYHSGILLKSRFQLPHSFQFDGRELMLESLGLSNNGLLQIKILGENDKVFVTDGPWVDKNIRVYPNTSESRLIQGYVRKKMASDEFDILIDPACGCGSHSINLVEIEQRISLDVNVRALCFARINGILAGMQTMLFGLSDIRDGLPDALYSLKAKSVLFAINMPFAIFPTRSAQLAVPSQNGGERGSELTLKAIDAVAKFRDAAVHVDRISAVILFYSLGRKDSDEWEVVTSAQEMFGKDAVTAKILKEQLMWRINGRKVKPNPMELSDLVSKTECMHTYFRFEQPEARAGYEKLESKFRADGLTHLGFGVLEIRVK